MYKIEEIAQVIGAERKGTAEARINWLLIDSRSLCFPEETLFFALRTEKNDGHKYIEELYRRGVRNFVVEEAPLLSPQGGMNHPDGNTSPWGEDGRGLCNFLVVKSPLQALQDLAAYHRSKLNIPVIGITGSNGKTTVKEWLYQLLSPDYNVCRSPRSYNSQVGVPLSVWMVNRHNDLAIIEAGISQPGEMERLEHIVKPTIGVMTNLGAAHQENFMSYEIKCSEKMKLFRSCDTVVINSQDSIVQRCAEALPEGVQRMSLEVRQVEKEGSHATIHFEYEGEIGKYTIPFIDDASVENSVTCFSTVLAVEKTLQALSSPQTLPSPSLQGGGGISGKEEDNVVTNTETNEQGNHSLPTGRVRGGSYFPSYEIMMDELRDYRFYADDMIHPSGVAVEYIWQRFQDTYFDNKTKDAVAKAAKEWRQSQHRQIVKNV